MTVSAEQISELIDTTFIKKPTSEGIARLLLSEFHLVRREPVTLVPATGKIHFRGEERPVPAWTDKTRERVLSEVQESLTLLDANAALDRQQVNAEVEKLAAILLTVSEVTAEEAREQAQEMFDMGARFKQDKAERAEKTD